MFDVCQTASNNLFFLARFVRRRGRSRHHSDIGIERNGAVGNEAVGGGLQSTDIGGEGVGVYRTENGT